MGTVVRFPKYHARASAVAASLKPKTDGAASLPTKARASRTIMKLPCEIRPRLLQLLIAEGPTPANDAAAAVPPNASITSSTELSMLLYSSRNVKASTLHTSAIEIDRPVSFNQGMAETAKSLANRLESTREALGISAADLCKRIKIKPNRWSQYESGERRITLEVANRLCDEFDLSLDWIYRANPAQLPHALRLKMRQAA